jgi:hypothetical protein
MARTLLLFLLLGRIAAKLSPPMLMQVEVTVANNPTVTTPLAIVSTSVREDGMDVAFTRLDEFTVSHLQFLEDFRRTSETFQKLVAGTNASLETFRMSVKGLETEAHRIMQRTYDASNRNKEGIAKSVREGIKQLEERLSVCKTALVQLKESLNTPFNEFKASLRSLGGSLILYREKAKLVSSDSPQDKNHIETLNSYENLVQLVDEFEKAKDIDVRSFEQILELAEGVVAIAKIFLM